MLAVCIPALNEAATIGGICESIVTYLEVAELVVIDGGSEDETAEIAKEAGARVVTQSSHPLNKTRAGKGAALYESVLQTEAEIIVWCDADLLSFTPDIITKLATPLVEDSSLMMVKGFYKNRKLDGKQNAGGRTSWLVARPLLSLFFPELAHIKEPLTGEYSMRRTAAEQVPFVCGYGVEIGLLIEVAKKFKVDTIAQVNLGTKEHKNQELGDLSVQALEILQTALIKTGIESDTDISRTTLHRPNYEALEVKFEELPPIR